MVKGERSPADVITPAMAAGLSQTVMDWSDIIALSFGLSRVIATS